MKQKRTDDEHYDEFGLPKKSLFPDMPDPRSVLKRKREAQAKKERRRRWLSYGRYVRGGR